MIKKAALVSWLVACLLVLLLTLYTYSPGPASDAGVLFAVGMTALTFPTGIVVQLLVIVSGSSGFWPFPELPARVAYSSLWFAFVSAGYLQWFVVLPWLWRRFKRWYSSAIASVEKAGP